ncbi:flagellar hook protein FlgE [Thiogranum longum]|uniref:Flagellar hook protein FlgE n=1 Tax=Thiogranum longum TaxID=1537524 RepID=A0A4R1HBS9_9GAMM|nr:flagellar hook protein FlgE [Thiogranum longum]TCK18868.1 flagellar hook protein FlgE [Thiogranum longum]
MPFRTALSGLNAASSELRIIGNNVANAGTTGFKESRAEFADIFATSNLGVASNAIGTGVRVSSVSQQFTQGNIGFTDNNLDLAISGQGFLIMNDNGINNYTRAGALGVDRDGFVVNNQQQQLTIFQADNSGNITGATGPLQLDRSDIAPAATTAIDVQANLDASAVAPTAPFDPTNASSYNNSTSLTVFDSLGSPHLNTMYFRKTADNTWDAFQFVDGAQVNAGAPAGETINFDSTGAITSGSPTSMTFTPSGGAAAMTVNVDYNNTSQFGSPFSVNALVQDGFATGRLSGIDISDTGIITSRFTNGQSRTLGQIAIATFNNPQGLRQLGDTSWAETFDSGAPLVGGPGAGSAGLIESGALEGSNVDLTEELVNMITAQRNFQANAQVITTADTITQTIINIR